MDKLKVSIIIPTYNAGILWEKALSALQVNNIVLSSVLVIDSSSNDDTALRASSVGFRVHTIDKTDFNHGGTRNLGLKLLDDNPDYIIFLTQDAILNGPNELRNIVDFAIENNLSAVCGRQLPHDNANCIAVHARCFNYPDQSRVNSKADIPKLGLKAAFCSNSFSLYKTSDFLAVGCFPDDVIFGEDMILCAKLIMADKLVGYCATAMVRHSHNYTFKEEFRRYFDIGVLHSRESDLLKHFGGVSGEGARFVKSEIAYVLKSNPVLILSVVIRTFLKYFAYKLGRHEDKLSDSIKIKLSMAPWYWSKSHLE